MACVFLEIGQDVHLTGGDLAEAIDEGVRRGYDKGYLRKSVVKDCACASSLEASFQRVTNAIALPCMDSQVKDMDFSSKLLTYSYNDLFCKTQHSLNAGCGNS